jgi:hypothetical protein
MVSYENVHESISRESCTWIHPHKTWKRAPLKNSKSGNNNAKRTQLPGTSTGTIRRCENLATRNTSLEIRYKKAHYRYIDLFTQRLCHCGIRLHGNEQRTGKAK